MSEVWGSAQSECVPSATCLADTVQTTCCMVVTRVSTKHDNMNMQRLTFCQLLSHRAGEEQVPHSGPGGQVR